MKDKIHPPYKVGTITCACGNTFQVRSTVGDMKLEICSNCHPFFTGKQKLIDTAGRVEKYMKKYGFKKTTAKKEKETKRQAQERRPRPLSCQWSWREELPGFRVKGRANLPLIWPAAHFRVSCKEYRNEKVSFLSYITSTCFFEFR